MPALRIAVLAFLSFLAVPLRAFPAENGPVALDFSPIAPSAASAGEKLAPMDLSFGIYPMSVLGIMSAIKRYDGTSTNMRERTKANITHARLRSGSKPIMRKANSHMRAAPNYRERITNRHRGPLLTRAGSVHYVHLQIKVSREPREGVHRVGHELSA